MNTEIHWGRVGVVLVAVVGIAGMFFVMGQKSREQASLPTQQQSVGNEVTNQTVIPQNTPKPIAKTANESVPWSTYSDSIWGFDVKYPSGYEAKVDVKYGTKVNGVEEQEQVFSIRKVNDLYESRNCDGVCCDCTLSIMINPDFIGSKGTFTLNDWVKIQGDGMKQVMFAGKTAYTDATAKPTAIYPEAGVRYDIRNDGTFVFLKNKKDTYDKYQIKKNGTSIAGEIFQTFTFTK